MDLSFLRLGWARFGFDISIRSIPLSFGPCKVKVEKLCFENIILV